MTVEESECTLYKLYKHLAVEINFQVHLVGVSEHCTHSSVREFALYTVPEQGVVK